MSISLFWLEIGGTWGSSPMTSPANHQKLNIIQKWAFHFLAAGGWQMGFKFINQPGWSSEVKHNPKMSISFFLAWDRRWMGFESNDQPGQSSEVECNTKMSISFFWLEKGSGCSSSPSTSPADHQKLNVIQKQVFHFLVGEGWWMGFESINQPSWSSEVEHNPKMRFSFFWLERAAKWDLHPSTSLANRQKLNVIQKQAFHFFG